MADARTTATAAKTERLLNLVLALLTTRRPLTRSHIRAAVPQYSECTSDAAFGRMFERDKDDLRAIGVPVVTSSIDTWSEVEDGYRVDVEAYPLPDIDLTPTELAALALAARMWEQAGAGPAAVRALLKLQALGIEADPDAVAGVEPRVRISEPAFEPLYRATWQRYPVSFGYRRPGQTEATRRSVDPWTLALRGGVWYLAGHDHDRGAPRVFRLSRMVGPWRRTGPPGSVTIPPAEQVRGALGNLDGGWPVEPAATVVATLRIRHGKAPQLRLMAAQEPAAPTSVGPVRPGFDVVRIPMRDVEGFAARVAGQGSDVIVHGPAELRDAVTRRWRAAALTHAGGASPALLARLAAADAVSAPVSTAPDDATPTIGPATAIDRLSRVLSLVPYLLERPGQPIAEVAARFGVDEATIVDDLRLVFVCGTPGHLPDDLIEADWSGGTVRVGNADAIARPLRLSGEEAVALLVGVEIVAGIVGPGERHDLDSAAAKIAAVLGAQSNAAATTTPVTFVAVREDTRPIVGVVIGALRSRRQLRLSYLSMDRDEVTDRLVDPHRLVHDNGVDYLDAWCHQVGDHRTFRLDRILHAEQLDTEVATTAQAATPVRQPSPTDTPLRVTLRLQGHTRWLAEYFHAERRCPLGDDDELATISLTHPGRIVRHALSSEGAIEVVDPPDVRALVAARARAALAGHDG